MNATDDKPTVWKSLPNDLWYAAVDSEHI